MIHPGVLLEIPSADIREHVPAKLHPALPPQLALPAQITLMVFLEEVVTSQTVANSLHRLATSSPLVVVAPNITADGIALLRDRRAHLFVRHEFYWTDESYRAARNR